MGKVKTVVTAFELPLKLGVLQYVEYEPPPREQCINGCLYEGVLTAEGCRRGICVKYRVWVHSRDRRKWEAKERWRRRRDEEAGGCLRQQVADALWELAERGYDVAVDRECNIAINGVVVSRLRCRVTEECVRQMLEEYKKRLESPPPPPRRSPEEEEYEMLLQQYAWLRLWRRDLVVALLRHNKQALLDVLQRLNEVPYYVAAFLDRFELDLRCVVTAYRGADNYYCVSFCIEDSKPVTYCFKPGHGWHSVPQPRFVRLKLEDGRLVEVYSVGGTELVRAA